MRHLNFLFSATFLALVTSCTSDDTPVNSPVINTNIDFKFKSTINLGGEGAAEISAYDPASKQIYTVNVASDVISVIDISDPSNPTKQPPINVSAYGSPNSVSVHNGKLAVAVEAAVKQNPGKVLVYNTTDATLDKEFSVGALPDMVTFSKDGKYIISANEGEPNDAYTVDPNGTVSIIDVAKNTVSTLDFTAFNNQESSLEAKGFRVFGPKADLAADVEPEYITVSEDSKTAWVSLQENNGIAKIDLVSKTIEAIYPLGFKDYSLAQNTIDASDKDGVKELKSWPVKGIYQPDAITSVKIQGVEYVISANEGDARDYAGFSEELRVEDLTLDPTVFAADKNYQDKANLGRLKTTTTLGDTDNDGDHDVIYSYGARSFSIWSATGDLVYDSGNSIAQETLKATPSRFNDDDGRSDDKAAEPESVTVLNIADQRVVLFVGLERNDQVLVYDITNPKAPTFLQILSHSADQGPEGLLAIAAQDSPSKNALLVVSNEDTGTVTIYENQEK